MRRELNKLGGDIWKDAKQAVTAFAIDKQRVSCRDFLDCIRQNGCKADEHQSYETVLRDQFSVCRGDDAYVAADQAEAYCAWRGRQLPTILQWQVAARGPEGARIVDAECVQRGAANVCQAISSFGVLVSARPGQFEEELTRTMDCFPEVLMGYRKGDDELGRARTVAVAGAKEIAGTPKLLLQLSNPRDADRARE